MRVLGIDPSLAATGICHVDGETETVKGREGDARLVELYDRLDRALYGSPDLAVIEDLPTHAQGAGKTGMAQGVVRYILVHTGTRYVTVTAATLKKFATGRGNATKPDMRMALYQRAGIDLRDDNQVDAWWLRQLGLHLLEDPERMELPQTHLAALVAVQLPEIDRETVRRLQREATR